MGTRKDNRIRNQVRHKNKQDQKTTPTLHRFQHLQGNHLHPLLHNNVSKVFQFIDKENFGYIDNEAIELFMEDISLNLSKDKLDCLMRRFDPNSKHQISYPQFKHDYNQPHPCFDKLMTHVQKLEKNIKSA